MIAAPRHALQPDYSVFVIQGSRALRRAASSRGAGVLGLALAATTFACAAPVERPLWEIGLGAAALRLPHYRGSDQSRNWLLPLPYFVYRGEVFKADREGARLTLLEHGPVEFDLSVNAGPPTRSRDNDARRGMDDLDPTFEAGPNLKLGLARGTAWKLELRLPLRAVLTVEGTPDFLGWAATPNLSLDRRLPGGWNLGLQAGPVLGSRRLHDHYYGVAPAEAAAGRPEYRAHGGHGGAQALAALSRRHGSQWLGAFVRADTVRGATFADSPLVRRRSHLSFGIAWAWVLGTSSARVVVDE